MAEQSGGTAVLRHVRKPPSAQLLHDLASQHPLFLFAGLEPKRPLLHDDGIKPGTFRAAHKATWVGAAPHDGDTTASGGHAAPAAAAHYHPAVDCLIEDAEDDVAPVTAADEDDMVLFGGALSMQTRPAAAAARPPVGPRAPPPPAPPPPPPPAASAVSSIDMNMTGGHGREDFEPAASVAPRAAAAAPAASAASTSAGSKSASALNLIRSGGSASLVQSSLSRMLGSAASAALPSLPAPAASAPSSGAASTGASSLHASSALASLLSPRVATGSAAGAAARKPSQIASAAAASGAGAVVSRAPTTMPAILAALQTLPAHRLVRLAAYPMPVDPDPLPSASASSGTGASHHHQQQQQQHPLATMPRDTWRDAWISPCPIHDGTLDLAAWVQTGTPISVARSLGLHHDAGSGGSVEGGGADKDGVSPVALGRWFHLSNPLPFLARVLGASSSAEGGAGSPATIAVASVGGVKRPRPTDTALPPGTTPAKVAVAAARYAMACAVGGTLKRLASQCHDVTATRSSLVTFLNSLEEAAPVSSLAGAAVSTQPTMAALSLIGDTADPSYAIAAVIAVKRPVPTTAAGAPAAAADAAGAPSIGASSSRASAAGGAVQYFLLPLCDDGLLEASMDPHLTGGISNIGAAGLQSPPDASIAVATIIREVLKGAPACAVNGACESAGRAAAPAPAVSPLAAALACLGVCAGLSSPLPALVALAGGNVAPLMPVARRVVVAARRISALGVDLSLQRPTRYERWAALGAVLACSNAGLRKVVADAKHGLLYAVLRCPLLQGLTIHNLCDPVVAAWMVEPDKSSTGGSNLKYNVGLQAIVRPQIPPSPSAPSSGALGDKVDISKVADIGSVLDAMCDMMLGPTGRSVAMPISVGGHASSSAGAAGASPASSMRPGGGAPATGDLLPIQRHLSQAIDLHAALERTLTAHGIIMPFERQEMRVLPALAAMDIRGMASMPSALSGFASVLSKAIEGLEAQAHALAGHTFLVSSAKQCAEVLYDELGLVPPSRPDAARKGDPTKKMHQSTDSHALAELSALHELPGVIMKHRKAFKLMTNFVQPLATLAVRAGSGDTIDGAACAAAAAATDGCDRALHRMHTSLQSTRTGTGRLSSRYPNMQNIPKPATFAGAAASAGGDAGAAADAAGDEGGDDDDDVDVQSILASVQQLGDVPITLRAAFCASGPGWTLLSIDYSQVEVRVFAHLCGNDAMITVFGGAAGTGAAGVVGSGSGSGVAAFASASAGSAAASDVYTLMAMQVYGRRSPADVTPAERQKCKVVTLGILYGQGKKEMARKLGTTELEAGAAREDFFRAYPGVRRYATAAAAFAERYGYVVTMAGRRRWLSDARGGGFGGARGGAASVAGDYDRRKLLADRQAVNTVVQGSAADLMKAAVMLVHEDIARAPFASGSGGTAAAGDDTGYIPRGTQMLLQIHDELLLECPAHPAAIAALAKRLTHIMTVRAPELLAETGAAAVGAAAGADPAFQRSVLGLLGGTTTLRVPLAVTVEVGSCWGSMAPLAT